MNGKKYKEIKKSLEKDAKLEIKKNKYSSLKIDLISNVINFSDDNNLINLERVVKDGIKILKLEGYPIKYGKKNK